MSSVTTCRFSGTVSALKRLRQPFPKATIEAMNKLAKPLALAEARSYARSGYGRDVRVKAGLSLADVAGAVGVSTATVHRWETGKYRPAGAAAYAAAARDELPCLRLGRRLVVPVPRLLDLLGATSIQSPPRDPPKVRAVR